MYTLKNKKLKSKIAIDQLFSEGKSVRRGALRCVYLITETRGTHKIGFSVSKRNFKNAVDRNRIKRLLREAYRLNQYIIPEDSETIQAMFLYQSRSEPSHEQIEKLMKNVLKAISETV